MKLRYPESLNSIYVHGLRSCLDGHYSSSSSAVERSYRKRNLATSSRLCHARAFSLSSNSNRKNNNNDITSPDDPTALDAYKQSSDNPQNLDEDSSVDGVSRDAAFDLIEVKVEKTGKNRRRIKSSISMKASLQRVWNILTDYERLADFIPGLAVSQLLEKKDKFARLFQIGQQELAFGLKFEAKGVIECYEGDLEQFSCSQMRDIDFKMIKGDFQLFEGTWSIEQTRRESLSNFSNSPAGSAILGQDRTTTLSYVVDVEPKIWLPVHLVEGRLCREIKMNLLSIKRVAEEEDTLF
ncbi:OLC1v1033459C5 [Oldenlandia corymbosa var. corymbosa]|uniref:OLC1v1033459C5 n=1 Tax=Oldenlandia corymbosa var. corymbosa TaxID=529605 RepID=A0AAV1CRJ3_OLDCO|nr:OLC1v1033459C5 [Oldenlandia corymbosa var. corymbosa]